MQPRAPRSPRLPTSPPLRASQKKIVNKQSTTISAERVASNTIRDASLLVVPAVNLMDPVTWAAPPARTAVKTEEETSTGFNQFRNTLYHLLERIEGPTLQSKWETVRHHLETYDNEVIGEDIKNCVAAILSNDSPPACDIFTCLHWLLGLLLRYNMSLGPYLSQFEECLLDCVYVLPPKPPQLSYETPPEETLRTLFKEKTYSQALKQYSAKMQKDFTDAENDIKKRIKLTGILNKVISYWQSAFLGRILISWKLHLRHEKEAGALQKRIEKYEKTVNTLEKKVEALSQQQVEAKAAADERARTLQIQLEVETKKRKKEKENYEERIQDLEEQVKKLISQRTEAEQRATEAEKLHAVLAMACKMGISDHEKQMQNTFLETKDLLQWVNTIIPKHDEAPLTEDMLYDGECVKTFLVLLKALAPKQIPDTVLKSTLQAQPPALCESILKICKDLGIDIPVTAQVLASDGGMGYRARKCFLTIVAQRVLAGPAGAQVPFEAPKLELGWFKAIVNPEPSEWAVIVGAALERQGRLRGAVQECLKPVYEQYVSALGESSLTKCEVRDKSNFVDKVDIDAFEDLLHDTSDEAKNEEAKNLRGVLEANYRVLRSVYKFYGANDANSGSAEIDQKEFGKLMKDCGLKAKDAKRIFATANTDDAGDALLTPSEYCTALVRCVAVLDGGKRPLSERFNDLVKNVIVPKAKYTNIEEFRNQLSAPSVQKVLSTHATAIRKVFRYYAKKANDNDPNLSYTEFQNFANDIRIIDTNCTYLSLKHMFLSLQDDVAATTNPTLDLKEFKDVLVGLSCFRYPAPYIPLYQKTASFLGSIFASNGSLAANIKF